MVLLWIEGRRQFFMGLIFCMPLLRADPFVLEDFGDLRALDFKLSGFNQELVVGKLQESYDFIWSSSRSMEELSHINSSQMPFVNAKGDVVGICWKKSSFWFQGNRWTKHLYLRKKDGSFRDLGLPEGWETRSVEEWKIGYVSEKEDLFRELTFWDKKEISILGFNDAGEILVGNSVKVVDINRFALWNGERFLELNLPLDRIYKMDTRGILLGRKWTKTDQGSLPLLVLYDWRSQKVIQELMPDIRFTYRELTQEGQVLLAQEVRGEERVVGLLWDPLEGWTQLGDFIPFKTNRKGQMIGQKEGRWFLWDRGELLNLEERLSGSNALWSKITRLLDFNDRGDILGEGICEGLEKGFLLRYNLD